MVQAGNAYLGLFHLSIVWRSLPHRHRKSKWRGMLLRGLRKLDIHWRQETLKLASETGRGAQFPMSFRFYRISSLYALFIDLLTSIVFFPVTG